MLEYEIGGARDGWLNRMNFLSPLDEWEFLEKREPPLSLSPSPSLKWDRSRDYSSGVRVYPLISINRALNSNRLGCRARCA